MATHVSVRLYWHDHGWDGSICRDPENVWCEGHDHIRDYNDPESEAAEAGVKLGTAVAKPPCDAEAGRQPIGEDVTFHSLRRTYSERRATPGRSEDARASCAT